MYKLKLHHGSTLPGRAILSALLLAVAPLAGCADIFGAGFLNEFYYPGLTPQPNGVIPGISIDNERGHVAMIFINNTRFSSRMLDYLNDQGVDLGDDPANLRALVRARFQITFGNGETTTIEFIDGARIVEAEDPLEGPSIDPPELDDLALRNIVLPCDVVLINPIGVEVFIPVSLVRRQLVITDQVETTVASIDVRPGYELLKRDDLDDSNTVTLVRNFDSREAPVPIVSVQCGSAVGFSISGELFVPFETTRGTPVPGFFVGGDSDQYDQVRARVPGRFKFVTSVR